MYTILLIYLAVLTVSLTAVFIVFFIHTFYMCFYPQSQARKQADGDAEDNRPKFSLINFHWQSRQANSSEDTCFNSVQGRDILVDDKGSKLVSHLA